MITRIVYLAKYVADYKARHLEFRRAKNYGDTVLEKIIVS
jgi:hypothetical protein